MKDSYSIITYDGSKLPDTYKNMIYSKWLRSLRFGNEYFKLIDSDSYYENYQIYIKSIITQATVKLAVLTDDHDVCLGWSISRPNTLDYVYVGKEYRKLGIGTSLITSDITTITHLTNTGMVIWNNKYKQLKFNPFK